MSTNIEKEIDLEKKLDTLEQDLFLLKKFIYKNIKKKEWNWKKKKCK